MALPPSWLYTPPAISAPPPVLTRAQILPFDQLAWEDFERLCLRLAESEADVEDCRLYGLRGQGQAGIDLYARYRPDGRYRTYQCKRERRFTASKIRDAVSAFLRGIWADRTAMFVLCTQEPLTESSRADEVERQRERLSARGVGFEPWDAERLSRKLKDLPRLVDDFFGRAWVREFCGEEAVASLGRRMDAAAIAAFRSQCGTFYRTVFNCHDPGLTIGGPTSAESLPLERRYVIPHVQISSATDQVSAESLPIEEDLERIATMRSPDLDGRYATLRQGRPAVTVSARQRHLVQVDDWLASHDRTIILGAPGSGKSALLRYVAIDLLATEPTMEGLARRWGGYLPVWVPFPLWTKLITTTGPAASITDMLRDWLHGWNEESLWPLVERALEDDRLLLLVDGLDEWADSSAARIALDRLHVFVDRRAIPTIATSRPHGFTQLGMPGAGWQVATLAGLSPVEQRTLSGIWFANWLRSTGRPGTDDDALPRHAAAMVEAFHAELRGASALQELAEIPLLLGLLISLKLQGATLPQSRFRAYDRLVEYLIVTHPERRRAAALVALPSLDLSPSEIEQALAYLALDTQRHNPEGSIESAHAIRLIESYLRDEQIGFGFLPREARAGAQGLLAVGEGTVGLLVRRSPRDLGFFHRTFQEFLAARSLTVLPLAEQLALVEEHCADPQWREVILAVLHLTTRPADVGRFIERLRARALDVVERLAVDSLLCEVACGEFHCPPGMARELVEEACQQVDAGHWMPQRERLLLQLLDGLRTARVREIIRERLRGWYPRRQWIQYSLYNALEEWPNDPITINCLWRGLQASEPETSRAAARSLAAVAGGGTEIGERVATLARSGAGDFMRSAAIEALLLGWPDHPLLDTVLTEARVAASPMLRLAAIAGAVRRARHSDADLRELMLLSLRTDLGSSWRGEIAGILAEGWPGSPELKRACLSAVTGNTGELDPNTALSALLQGFSLDGDVADYCIAEIRNAQHPFLGYFGDRSVWGLLSVHFRDHPGIVEAIDEWLPEQQFHELDIVFAAVVGRTSRAKAKLLEMLSPEDRGIIGRAIQHPTHALLEFWGMGDPEVAARLLELAYGPNNRASWIAHHLPRIIADHDACRDRLAQLLRDPGCQRPDFVVAGLREVGGAPPGTDVVGIVLDEGGAGQAWYHSDALEELIVGYSNDPRVRDLALRELAKGGGYHTAVALAYKDDEEMRQRVAAIASPLPLNLRQVIAARLGEGSGDEAFAIEMLRQYDDEMDEEVKTQAAIGYGRRLRTAGQDLAHAIDRFHRDLDAKDFHAAERHQAAIAGLVELGRWDIVQQRQTTQDGTGSAYIGAIGRFKPNMPLIETLLRHWDVLNIDLENDEWRHRLGALRGELALLNAICAAADGYPSARESVLRTLERRPESRPTVNILSFVGRHRPGSRLLADYCIAALRSASTPATADALELVGVASELLATNFGADEAILLRLLEARDTPQTPESITIALCAGWPESPQLASIHSHYREEQAQVTYLTWFQVQSRFGSGEVLADALRRYLVDAASGAAAVIPALARPIVRRLRSDADFAHLVSSVLRASPTPSEQATLPRLLASAQGLSDELREQVVAEIEAQLASPAPVFGVDLRAGRPRLVAHALLDLLTPPVGGE